MTTKKNTIIISKLLVFFLLVNIFAFVTETDTIFASTHADNPNRENSGKVTSTIPPADAPAIDIRTVDVAAIEKQTYNGKAKRPSVVMMDSGSLLVKNQDYKVSYKNNKNPGTATVTVKGIGRYYGINSFKFKIVINAPKKVKIKNNQKQITVSWKKVPAVTGYEVYLASNGKFTKKKRVKVIKSRKKTSYSIPTPIYKRSYNVKIRAYKTIKGKKYYSKFSKIKKIKTKNQKWIRVDLKKQKIYLKKGKKKVKTYVVSTGKKKTPTIKGTFYIYKKNPKHDMVGQWDPKKKAPEYIQPDVLWSTYFIRGYAFHATYWHNNFGNPMSHGCVNMKTKEAKYLYKWAPIGTKVVVR